MGAKERSENLTAEGFMTMRDHSHFAGASKPSHRTAQAPKSSRSSRDAFELRRRTVFVIVI